MRTSTAAALAILAGCSGPSVSDNVRVDNDRERDTMRVVQEAFDRWNRATQTGDAEASYRGLSTSLKSQWLWERMRDRSDTLTPGYIARLDPTLRTILEKWYEAHEKSQPPPGRATGLSELIVGSRWLFDLYRDHFARAKAQVVAEAKHRVVTQVYIDDSGATVQTDVQGVSEIIGMTFEGDGWKVDTWRHAVRKK